MYSSMPAWLVMHMNDVISMSQQKIENFKYHIIINYVTYVVQH